MELEIIIRVKAPVSHAIGVKEQLAMICERYGDIRVVSVTEIQNEQLTLEGGKTERNKTKR